MINQPLNKFIIYHSTIMKKTTVLLSVFILFSTLNVIAQRFPFPQHTPYHTHIKPSQYSQSELDEQVTSFYDQWKEKYLINGCESNQYYVFFDSGNTLTVSEAMGYGMLITPIMAGYDPDAKRYFDGLYRYYKAHPSHIMPHLMAWKQITGCKDADGPDSATDGDIDIAFGLLLAHAQWGSNGAINYFREAQLIIEDIMGNNASEGDINQDYYSIKLGDWVRSGHFMTGTRTSDFITDHFRAFSFAVNDTTWNKVTDKCYSLIDEMQTNYSPETGLLPDFIINVNDSAQPAPPNYLEGDLDGNYSYNACRDPWRLNNDYLINGDERARDAVVKINKWLVQATGGSVNNIYAGYYLDGTKAVGWSDIAFTAPFAVGAMADTSNQEWLNLLYSRILSSNIAYGGYYDNTLKLLAMITLSGNYWVPDSSLLNGIKEKSIYNNPVFTVYPSVTTGKINIKVGNNPHNEKLYIKVTGLTGRVITRKNYLPDNTITLRLDNFPPGICFITITGEKGTFFGTQKIILR